MWTSLTTFSPAFQPPGFAPSLAHFPKITSLSIFIYRVAVVQLLRLVRLFATPWTAAQASLSSTIFWSLLRFMSTESMMPSIHLIICCPFLLLPSIFPSIKVFSSELAVDVRSPRISATGSGRLEGSGLISSMPWMNAQCPCFHSQPSFTKNKGLQMLLIYLSLDPSLFFKWNQTLPVRSVFPKYCIRMGGCLSKTCGSVAETTFKTFFNPQF